MSFTSNGSPPVLRVGTETRTKEIAADMGVVGGLAGFAIFANRMRRKRLKRAPQHEGMAMEITGKV